MNWLLYLKIPWHAAFWRPINSSHTELVCFSWHGTFKGGYVFFLQFNGKEWNKKNASYHKFWICAGNRIDAEVARAGQRSPLWLHLILLVTAFRWWMRRFSANWCSGCGSLKRQVVRSCEGRLPFSTKTMSRRQGIPDPYLYTSLPSAGQ